MWKHSYMEVLPLTQQMYYFSDTFRSCQDLTAGWCNVDRKGRFNAEEMMIAAYHNNHLVYAYRGRYNHNIDHEWSGGILLDPKVCVDHCQHQLKLMFLQHLVMLEQEIYGYWVLHLTRCPLLTTEKTVIHFKSALITQVNVVGMIVVFQQVFPVRSAILK